MRKGVIVELKGQDANGNADKAIVSPIEARALYCTAALPWWLRGKAGDLSEGTEVVFERFIDGSAFVVARADGGFGGVIYGSVKLGDADGVDAVALAAKVKANDRALADILQTVATHTHPVSGAAAAASPQLAPYSVVTVSDVGAQKVEAK